MSESEPRNATLKVLSGDDFRIWRVSRDLDFSSLARMLGVSSQSVKKYEVVGMNRTQALALAAIDGGLQPYTVTDEDRGIAEDICRKQTQEP